MITQYSKNFLCTKNLTWLLKFVFTNDKKKFKMKTYLIHLKIRLNALGLPHSMNTAVATRWCCQFSVELVAIGTLSKGDLVNE